MSKRKAIRQPHDGVKRWHFRKRGLCERCQTGLDSYILDSRSPECPYLPCHNGKRCTMFAPKKHG